MITEKVTLNEDDRVELYHMLKVRGGSNLKTKLLAALDTLDQRYNLMVHAQAEAEEENA